jgi:hypothetical protein
VLTPKGAEAKSEILEEFRTPPPAFLKLERGDLEMLEKMLQKVQSPTRPGAAEGGSSKRRRCAPHPDAP